MTALKGSTDRLLDAESVAELLDVRPPQSAIGKLHQVKIGRLTHVWESEPLTLIPHEEKGQAK